MKSSVPTRVNYFDRQFLRKNEFVDEQSYQIDQRRRHNIAHHSWGIVVGLEIAVEEEKLGVRPGLAIDGYGRELFLSAKSLINEEDFDRLGSNRLDVWLFYETVQNPKTPKNGVCDNASSDSRTSELPRVFLERARPGHVNGRAPKGVPSGILAAPTQLRTTDDPLSVWPVYLGRVTIVPEETDPRKKYVVDASDRVYAGVMAETIDHPGIGNRISLGPLKETESRQIDNTEYVYETNPKFAFAIYVVPDALQNPDTSSDETQVVKVDARFAMDSQDRNFLRGKTSIEGNLQIKGALQFTDPTPTEALKLPDDSREPIIYRFGPSPEAINATADELRIDLGLNSIVKDRKLVIGFTKEDGTFVPSVTLEYKESNSDPLPIMTIEGDLTLKGKVRCRSLVERSLSPETLNALLASFQAGSIAAGGQ